MQRTEQGKSLRKDYESGKIKHGFNDYREAVPRNDGMTNTISTVQKDNLLIEREREQLQSTSHLTNQEQLTEQTASRQDMMQEFQILDKTAPVLLSSTTNQGVLLSNYATQFNKKLDYAATLEARDWRGFGNQAMTGVITIESKTEKRNS